MEELSWATGRAEVQSSKNLTTPQSYGWEKSEHPRASCEVLCQQLRPRQRQQPPPQKKKRLDKYITTLQLSWDHFGKCAVEELRCATQGSLWPVCCGRAKLRYSGITLASVLWRAKLRYSGITLASVLWKSYVALLRDHFGQCAVEELSCATQGSLWPVCCGRAKLRYSGITLASVLWKS